MRNNSKLWILGVLMLCAAMVMLFAGVVVNGVAPAKARANSLHVAGQMAPADETETVEPGETRTPEATETEHANATETEQPHATETEEPHATGTEVPHETETEQPEPTEVHGTQTAEPHETETAEPQETETEQPHATETEHPEITGTVVPHETETEEPHGTETAQATETEQPEPSETAQATRTAEPTETEVPGGGARSFPQTGRVMRGVFLSYWESHGGLAQQGYPITSVMMERSDLDGKVYAVQYTERAVFEYHPENMAPYNVLLSQLGTFQYRAKYPNGAPGQVANKSTGAVYFAQTGHWVGSTFLKYWQANGGLMQQGYPISDEFTEVSALDGKTYTVQYFERAVFEYHPELAGTKYEVLLSQLGTFRYRSVYGSK